MGRKSGRLFIHKRGAWLLSDLLKKSAAYAFAAISVGAPSGTRF